VRFWRARGSFAKSCGGAFNLHRWLGRLYLLEVGLGPIAGFAMAVVSEQGLPTHLGFGMLAVLWFFTGLQAYRMVRRENILAYRQWMIRNFALTLAAVTLRNYMPLMLFVLHWSFRPTYITVSWPCWIPNLLIAEWIVRRRATSQDVAISMKTDHTNVLIWRFLQSQSPLPFFSALDARKNLVSIDIEHSIFGIRPPELLS